MMSTQMKVQFTDYLFSFDGHQTYAIIDGAAVPGIVDALMRNEAEYFCLLSGKIKAELAETAPYLVKLVKQTPFYDWMLESWGKNFGIIAIIPNELSFKDVRTHFRRLLMVNSPEGEPLYFRFYDPRTMRDFLPICNDSQAQQIFGQVKLLVLEGQEATSVIRYWQDIDSVASKESKFVSA